MTTAYEELVGVLYDEKDIACLEWAIGSALQLGPQKTVVIYGDAASGKTTIMKIIGKIFEGTSIVDIRDDALAIDAQDGYLFFAVNRPLNHEELSSMDDVLLVNTSGRVHNPSRYQQLVSEILNNMDELRIIAQKSVHRYGVMGPNYYDHVIPTHIPEENA